MSKKKLSKKLQAKRAEVKLAEQHWPKCAMCGYEFPLLKALGVSASSDMLCSDCEKKQEEILARRERIRILVEAAIDKGDRLRLQTWGKGAWFNVWQTAPKVKVHGTN